MRFGPFVFDPQKKLLLRRGAPVHFARNPMKALECVLQNRRRAVTYDELIEAIWGDKTASKTKDEVRKTVRPCFNSLAHKGHRFIQLIPQYGYRFMPLPGVPKSSVSYAEGSADAQSQGGTTTGATATILDGVTLNKASENRVLTPIGRVRRDELFCYEGNYVEGYAEAIRLFGTADEYVSPERFDVKYEHRFYKMPPSLEKDANERIARLEDEKIKFNRFFFNGPNIRLLRWHHNQIPPEELDTLDLVVGASGWYDLEGTNGLVREGLQQAYAYKKYVDLQKIRDGNMEEGCQLSNVIGNAITIFTSDGKVGFQQRGRRQSAVPNWITSSVAENVNRYKDDVQEKPWMLLNSRQAKSQLARDATYHPKGTPHPLAAVRRGIEYEASPRLVKYIGPLGIKITGLAFGLDCLAPDLLWIVLADVTESEFKTLRRDTPGKEVDEGTIEFVPASFGSETTQEVLCRPNWVPAGKASLIRAIQLIEEFMPDNNPADAFDELAKAR